MNPPPTLPSTSPRHPRDDLQRFVNDLNVRYNLGIPIPDPALTPARRREDETSASRIYHRLETHFFRGGIEALTSLLRELDRTAEGYWAPWVKKPKANQSDLLPTPVRPPLAASLDERVWLQDLFNDILDKAQPSMSTPRPFRKSKSGPAAFGGGGSPKRPADTELGESLKKAKADPNPGRSSSASASSRLQPASMSARASACTSARKIDATPAEPFLRPQTVISFNSASTSRGTSFASTVFSTTTTKDVAIGTQETIEASTLEQLREPKLASSWTCSQQSYIDGPSSTMEDALRKAHRQLETSFPASNPPSPGTVPSYPVSSAVAEALQSAESEVQDVRSVNRSISGPIPSKDSSSATAKDGFTVRDGLRGIWPIFPPWLQTAPFPAAWEVTRIAQHCGVDLADIVDLQPNSTWVDQNELRQALAKHSAFQGKGFPESSAAAAWMVGLEQSALDVAWAATASRGLEPAASMPLSRQVVYSASLDFKKGSKNTLQLTMYPLKLDLPHRLARRFGADRFLELLVPSPDSSNLPTSVMGQGSFFDELVQWLGVEHAFCGRSWAAFYTKSGGSRKPVRDLQFGPDNQRPVYRERLFFFAGRDHAQPSTLPELPLTTMLAWALDLKRKPNWSQPFLKLFQRISLLLSKTSPTVIFKPFQIHHRNEDVRSSTGKVMNDGVARMSPAVARGVRDCLGLTTVPSAVQGRLGSAKGMWIVDGTTADDDIWIETFPSQRKWELDWDNADQDHLTLEVRNVASMPKSAGFNLQFLPVIEDRAGDNKDAMRVAIADLLRNNLQAELDGQKKALQDPLQFRQWTHENANHQHDRLVFGSVPYLGGMPKEDEELMACMLDAGFDPRSNRFLTDIAYDIQRRKCDTLSKKLNITVGRSAYLYMVVDFSGVLAENEVHIGFSTAFAADEWSETMVQGMPVLVARSPAHFISDIQKVQAVFKPDLAHLKDVVVFPTTGDTPLADKLSGGDYDGDLAWVCWDSRIVDNFENADVQQQPDLSDYMPQHKCSFRDLLKRHKNDRLTRAVGDWMSESFKFNLSKSMLGVCTNYKERLCYHRQNVCDDAAKLLSTLLSNLVDQAKQGITFTAEGFDRLRQASNLPKQVDNPRYKDDHWALEARPDHIIDFLKFEIAKPTIAKELKKFHDVLVEGNPQHWDSDIAADYHLFENSRRKSRIDLVQRLKHEIQQVADCWNSCGVMSYADRVAQTYRQWQAIPSPSKSLTAGGEMSVWALLKASTAFWMYCNGTNRKPRFVWQMAARQLCFIKAREVTSRAQQGLGAGAAPSVVVPSMYAALRPDAKFVKQMAARMDGGTQFGFEGNGGIHDESDECDGMMDKGN